MRRLGLLLLCTLGCTDTPSEETSGAKGSIPDTASLDTGKGPTFGPVDVDPDERPPDLLSDLQLIAWDGRDFSLNDGVVPYTLNMPLFSDHALKFRTIWIPDGTPIQYTAEGILDFPVGTLITKSFLFPLDFRDPDQDVRLIETRLLIRGSEGWKGWPYIWAVDGSDARLDVTGEVQEIDFVYTDGSSLTANYLIPQKNQCVECHEIRQTDGTREMTLIGPQARTMNHDYSYPDGEENQLLHLASLGMLDGLPPLTDVPQSTNFTDVAEIILAEGTDALDPDTRNQAARDYMDANCAHCHNPKAVEGVSSQVWLNHDSEDLFHLGVCKRPSSAGEGTGGLDYNVVPGNAEASILWYRTATTNVGAMMPQIGRSLADEVGSDLIAAWINDLAPADCSD